MRSKSAASVRILPVWRTSGSHIRKYAPLPDSTKPAEYKRFRSICVKLNFTSYAKEGTRVLLDFNVLIQFLIVKGRV